MVKKVKDTNDLQMDISVISGIKLLIVRIGVALTIIGESFRLSRSLPKSVSLLISLVRERVTLHENKGNHKIVRAGSRYYWSVNMPGWPSSNFKYFVQNEYRRINSPQSSNLQTIIFAITNVCPLNCIHCYESENISDTNKLSFDDLKLVMDKIISQGIIHIQFSGGEPLSRFDDMIDLMRYAGMSNDYWINTSGFGLTLERARIMKKNGMIGVIISLDDWDEDRHNRFRQNEKSFFWVQEAARNCNEAGLIVCLAVCAVKEFVSEANLNRLYNLSKEMGVSFLRIFEPRRAGRFAGSQISLNSSEIEIIHQFVITRNSEKAFRKYPIIQFPGNSQRVTGCVGAGNRYIYIDSNGDYHACPFCRKPLGNALTDSLSEGIRKAREAGCQGFKQRALI